MGGDLIDQLTPCQIITIGPFFTIYSSWNFYADYRVNSGYLWVGTLGAEPSDGDAGGVYGDAPDMVPFPTGITINHD